MFIFKIFIFIKTTHYNRIYNMFNTQGQYIDNPPKSELEKLTYANNIHKSIQHKVKTFIKPDIKLLDIVEFIEHNIETELPNQVNKGKAFPVGVSVNNCAAHFTCHEKCEKILKKDDLISIDYGVHYDGNIIDSAFTFSLDNKYDELLQVSREATELGIKNLNIDVYIPDWGKEINEFVSSKEITIDGKVYPLKTITQLTGHNIKPWVIHGGTYLPSFKFNYPKRVTEDVYAVEIFVTTGNDKIRYDKDDNSHFTMEKYVPTKLSKVNKFQKDIQKRFKTLPFCDRWLSDINSYQSMLNILVKKNIVKTYPPIYDEENSYVSQFENTIYLKDNKKIIFG